MRHFTGNSSPTAVKMAMATEYSEHTFSRLVRCRRDRLSETMHNLLNDPDRFLGGTTATSSKTTSKASWA